MCKDKRSRKERRHTHAHNLRSLVCPEHRHDSRARLAQDVGLLKALGLMCRGRWKDLLGHIEVRCVLCKGDPGDTVEAGVQRDEARGRGTSQKRRQADEAGQWGWRV